MSFPTVTLGPGSEKPYGAVEGGLCSATGGTRLSTALCGVSSCPGALPTALPFKCILELRL